jgi:hypothetical protein
MRSTTHHSTLTTLAVASLVTVLAAGCGQGSADRRANELEDATAAVVAGACAPLEPWEIQARQEYWERQDIHDGWEHRLIAEHEQRLKATEGPRRD